MPDYRINWIGADGRWSNVQGIEAKNDDEAQVLVQAMKLPLKCELWARDRMVPRGSGVR